MTDCTITHRGYTQRSNADRSIYGIGVYFETDNCSGTAYAHFRIDDIALCYLFGGRIFKAADPIAILHVNILSQGHFDYGEQTWTCTEYTYEPFPAFRLEDVGSTADDVFVAPYSFTYE